MAKEILKNTEEKELRALLLDKRNLLRDFRFKIAKGKAKNVKEGANLKKEIARLLTEINKRNKLK